MSANKRHRGLMMPFEHHVPAIDPTAFVAEQSAIIGDVTLGPSASVWFQCTVRADQMPIRIGARSNIQDNSVIHVTGGVAGTTVGEEVTVGHRVILHACTVGNRVLVGMGSIVLDLAVIEDDVLLAAGSLVTPRTVLPSGWLCRGAPAKPVRKLTDDDRAMIAMSWQAYVDLGNRY
ncbi:MAG: gamma carbonic anhydrase family protein [Deltaproteobacteria bacterium]|nr:gamma carbonic anhydrase family protein [Deltaproteobacteria bacterium]